MTDIDGVREWFAGEVKERMEDLGLKPYNVAGICKMDYKNFYSYLRGTSFPKLWNLILIAECLNCSTNDLLGYDDVEDIDVYEKFLASETYTDESDYAVRFGRRFFRVMNEMNTTSEEIHELTGISVQTIDSWIGKSSETLPSVIQVIRLCDALETTPADLLGY